jgi:hypothetical protein
LFALLDIVELWKGCVGGGKSPIVHAFKACLARFCQIGAMRDSIGIPIRSALGRASGS